MTKRRPEIQKMLDTFTKTAFGTIQTSEACVCCKTTKVQTWDFVDEISRKEFKISGMCQGCQDNTFGAA